MNIRTATESYEKWKAARTQIIKPDLEFKHEQMAAAAFPFFRATFYRWVQLWKEVCPGAAKAPSVLAVGDLHVENFGTWRDLEGRLIWGVNDFDEVYPMAYTNDLVRLAVSAHLAVEEEHLQLSVRDVCDAVLDGYREGKIDRLYVVHARFLNTMTQKPEAVQLLPVVVSDEADSELQQHWDYIYEPEASAILDGLLMRYIEAQVYRGAVENVASEMAARMVAMGAASDNAGELISELQLVYNKARQAAITKELAEIVGGAAAV